MATALLVAGQSLRGDSGAAASQVDLQLELARKEQFYLELEPATNRLRLQLAGVALRTYALLAVEAGVPRIAFVPLADAAIVTGTLYPAGQLAPPRPELRLEILPAPANADSTSPPLQLPPRFDEIPVPWTYRLHFGEDLTVIVTSSREAEQQGPLAAFGILRDKLVDVTKAFSPRQPVLRLTLSRTDAEHLYRALPPETGLLVLGP